MSFSPMLEPPEPGNPYFNNIQGGGFNPCIVGNWPRETKTRRGRTGLNVLPNCVGFCTGRFNQIIGEGRCKYLGNFMAYYMATAAKMQGLKVQKAPSIGGVMVWSSGKSGSGHVASVEAINADGSVITSESEWNGLYFANYRRQKGDGNWRGGCSWMGASYKYIGCIVNPYVESEDKVTQKQFNEMMDTWLKEQQTKAASGYASEALSWAKDGGIMNGNESGNLMPQSFIKRQDMALMLKRYNDKCGDPLGLAELTE